MPGRLVELLDDQVAPLPIDRVPLGEEAEIAGQRRDRRRLADRTRVRGRLQLDHAHGPDQVLRAAGVADPPAGHRVALGVAVERQRPVLQRSTERRREAKAVVHELLVDLVGQDRHAGAAQTSVSALARPRCRPARSGCWASSASPLVRGPIAFWSCCGLSLKPFDSCRSPARRRRASCRDRSPSRARDQHLVARVQHRLQRLVQHCLPPAPVVMFSARYGRPFSR